VEVDGAFGGLGGKIGGFVVYAQAHIWRRLEARSFMRKLMFHLRQSLINKRLAQIISTGLETVIAF
jgi:hypothetical protein